MDDDLGAIAYYQPDVVSYSDYYLFGMQLDSRHASSGGYRYGFNGMEANDEVKGLGNSYTTEWRQYDPRVSSWLSTDPLAHEFSWNSPYVSMSNNPILRIDPDCDADGIYIDEETGEVLGEDEKGVDDGLVHYTSKENWDKFANSPAINKSELLKSGSKTINIFDELSKRKDEFLTATDEYSIPELDEDMGYGMSLLESLIIASTESTINTSFKYPEPKATTASANKILRGLSNAASKLSTAWLIVDKGSKIYNAYLNKNYNKAAQETTVLAGYVVAGRMMGAPHPYVKLAGCVVLLGTGVYEWLTGEEAEEDVKLKL
ncbi:hypothetical protein GCM10009118_24050 [Wandonia haliotis]|uniref:RHS repeat-associated core domain-containing protein n=1 Tax=Wandonia haliotis TaxID=574963 RepID=A0ABN1MRJ9_9FLAO